METRLAAGKQMSRICILDARELIISPGLSYVGSKKIVDWLCVTNIMC